MWFSPYEGRRTHCSPQQRAHKAASPASGDRMSLLSPHLAFQHKPLIFCGSLLASLHCRRVVWITRPICEAAGFRVPPSSRPLKSLSVFCRGPLLWPAPLVSISSGDSTDTLKAGSKWISRPKMCWKMPGWRRLPQTRVSWTQILAEVGSRMALVSLQSVQSRPAWWMKTKWFRTKHGAWIQALLSHGDSAWGQVEKLQKGLQRHSSKISALNCPTIFKSTNN